MGNEIPGHDVLFPLFAAESGSSGSARARFQRLITDMVGIRVPTASEVAGSGGYDWGIDTYVGRLDETVAVWQSKYFADWKGETQRGQVRDSFNEIVKKASHHGFKISSWTLCVPCVLPPEEQLWFDKWRTGKKRQYKFPIELWNGIELRRQLSQPDMRDVFTSYFPTLTGAGTAQSYPVPDLQNPEALEDALFVRQLKEAGYVETDAAKGLFFAAEAMARDVAARAQSREVDALSALHLDAHGLWEDRFNEFHTQADEHGRIPGLIKNVMSAAAEMQNPPDLLLHAAHRKGLLHRLVEASKAGWTIQWKTVAQEHTGDSATTLLQQHGEFQQGEFGGTS